jgi:hypothetical protein
MFSEARRDREEGLGGVESELFIGALYHSVFAKPFSKKGCFGDIVPH